MGPHPVPQNVTSFQFHLIGDMTLKQFAYLAAGVSIAYLIFVFFATSYPLVSWPLIVISSGLGAAFAFIPIGSRPLDHWAAAFFKAIYSPTQMSWRIDGKSYKEEPLFNNRYLMFVSGLHPIPAPPVQVQENPAAQTLRQALTPTSSTQPSQPATQQVSPSVLIQSGPAVQPASPELQRGELRLVEDEASKPTVAKMAIPANLPSSEELKKTVDLARQAQAIQVQIIQTERTLNQIKTATSQSTTIPVDYSHEVNKILLDLQKLVGQANTIKGELDSVGQPTNTPKPDPKQFKEKVKIVIPEKPKQAQISLTTFPNVINGIVIDNKNNYINGVVVVIYDKEGLPVRALKTNKLGQFSGSTPLSNGTYTLELEKDGCTFDVLQIQLDGQVMPPVLITAK